MTTMTDRAMEWIAEADFIARIDPQNPGRRFNHDAATFENYCAMQANRADVDGFYLVADGIREHAGLETVQPATPTWNTPGYVHP